LRYFDPNKKIYLTTDASNTAISAWLGQLDENNKLKPFICCSKKLNETQQRWGASKKELYSLMYGMQKFRHYLLGTKFICNVDHLPLVGLFKNKITVLMEGWLDTILSFDFDVVYIPGESNTLADAISRKDEDTEIVANVSIIDSTNKDNILLFEAEKRGKKVPILDERIPLIEKYHILNHFGLNNIYNKIYQDGYFWPKMRDDIKKVISGCTQCLRFDTTAHGYHPSKSIEAENIFDHIQIDLIGPHTESNNGYNFILNAVDVLSGYCILRPLKTKSEDEVAQTLLSIICEYGPPKIIQSDQGTEFLNKVVKALLNTYGIDHRIISAYHPSADGLVERKNKEVSRLLKKLMEGNSSNWQYFLPTIQLSLNNTDLTRTGSTPISLMFARKFNDFEDFSNMKINHKSTPLKLIAENKVTFLKDILPAIVEKSKQQKDKDRDNLDNKHNIINELKPGTRVYTLDKTRESKWNPKYEGPFTVVKRNQGGAYELKDATDKILKRKFPVDQLKIIPDDAVLEENEDLHYDIEKILDYRRVDNTDEYLIKWKHYEDPDWIKFSALDDVDIVNKFWKERGKVNKALSKSRKTKAKIAVSGTRKRRRRE
jgi:RNase H-like domain found in reverse transcriptase/Integrase core domain/Integrase zinc binding domain